MGQDQITPPMAADEDIHWIVDDSLTERNVCLVTGGASGIGRATALAAAGNGLTVAATDVDGERARVDGHPRRGTRSGGGDRADPG